MATPSSRARIWLAAAAILLTAGAVLAQEPDDCGHPVSERSIRGCSALIDLGPTDPHRLATLLIERGAHYIVLGDFAAALADLDRAVAVEPGNPAALTTRGDVFSRRAGVSEFVARWDAAARRDETVDTEQDQGRRGDYERAVADYTAALKADPSHLPAYFGRSLAHRALGDTDASDSDRRDAAFPSLRHLHRSQSAYFIREMALLLDPAGYTKSAIERFERLDADIRDRPNDPKPYLERAWAFVNYGESTRALADYTKAIAVDPNSVDAWMGRGDELFEAGNIAGALADFEQVVRLEPDHFRGYSSRGLAYERLGERDKAIADYRKALSLEPRAGYATDGLKRLGAAP
jgi:tetratricopeptide (TPR) repeat protein